MLCVFNTFFFIYVIFYYNLTYTSFHLKYGGQTDSDMLAFINMYDIYPFLQYSPLVFQPLLSSDGHDEFHNPDSQVDTYNDIFTRHYFDLDNEDLEKLVLHQDLIHAFPSLLQKLEAYQKKFKRFKWTIANSSLISHWNVYFCAYFDLFTNNASTLHGGLYSLRDLHSIKHFGEFFCNV